MSTQVLHNDKYVLGHFVRIAPMQRDNLDAVVEVHLSSFEGFFLSFLGPRFLHLLYQQIIRQPDAVALVAIDGTNVVGFVAGVAHQSRFYSQLVRRQLFSFAFASLSAGIHRPSIIPRLFRALTYSRSSDETAAQSVLMSIAVAPGMSGRGIGQQLVTAFLNEMRVKGVMSVSLMTDQRDNERTNHFYQKLGFELVRTYVTPEGRAMNEYQIHLETSSQTFLP